MTASDTGGFDYAAFRNEVRTFAVNNCPQDIRQTVASGARIGRHQYITFKLPGVTLRREPALEFRPARR